jgi:outer membrane protein
MEQKMKKILTSLVTATVMATAVNADFVRIEAGAGAWMNTPSGSLLYSETGIFTGFSDPANAALMNIPSRSLSPNNTTAIIEASNPTVTGAYKSKEESKISGYAWMLVKHPIPILPNIRLEYTGISDNGLVQGKFSGFTIPTGEAITASLDMKQFDIVPYYNILDNTAWITLDVGLDLKILLTDYEVSAGSVFKGHSETTTLALPLAYVRTRVQIPLTDIGFETDVKYVTYKKSSYYDIRAKVDYTLGFIPVVQPAFEIGYRIQKFDLSSDDDKTKMNLEFSGAYAGLMVRF